MSEVHSKQKTVVYGDLIEEQETKVKKSEDNRKPQFGSNPFADLGKQMKLLDKSEIKKELPEEFKSDISPDAICVTTTPLEPFKDTQ